MFGFLKRLKPFKKNPAPAGVLSLDIAEEKWEADFSKPKHIRFDIKPESAYEARVIGRSLSLSLKKSNCIAWVQENDYRYRDQVIEAKLRLDPMNGYAAAGLMFRIVDDATYYMVLVSSKSYFRFDVVRNGMPLPLIGWTELPARLPETQEPSGLQAGGPSSILNGLSLTVIAYGNRFIFLIDGLWAGEINDASISAGILGFACASYEAPAYDARGVHDARPLPAARAFLEKFSVESRIAEVEKVWRLWEDSPGIDPLSRFHLAETFAAMAAPAPALAQLNRVWNTPGYQKNQKELLLASRLAQQLEQYDEAETYIEDCLDLVRDSPEGREAVIEKAKILYAHENFAGLKDYIEEALIEHGYNSALYTLLGHALFNLGDNEKAAAAYDKAFDLDRKNGLPVKNAANMYELAGKNDEAFSRYIAAGNIFLDKGNYEDLGVIVPKLLSLGDGTFEAHALAGKWAFGIENWVMAENEFVKAEKIRKELRPKPHKDPAMIFLRGLLCIREGKRQAALPFLEEAVKYAPDYALFHFRLAETIFLLDARADDPQLNLEIRTALELLARSDDEPAETAGWVNNFAAQVELARGELDTASEHLEKAASLLGEVPAIRVNRGVHFYLSGALEKALQILEADKSGDPEGIMANCAGNLLVRAGQYEKANEYYRKALSIAPANIEFMTNRASCLIEMGYYGEADTLLSQAHEKAPSPALLELIGYVAAKKGEFARAESASKAALNLDSDYLPSLFSLGWLYSSTNRWDEAKDIIDELEEFDLAEEDAERLKELKDRYMETITRLVACAFCNRSWRVPRSPPSSPPIRLYAMPPDDLPAGACLSCGKTYCIGCAKEHIDGNGRFICPVCGNTLKLVDEGLKKIVADWASTALPKNEPAAAEQAAEKTPNETPADDISPESEAPEPPPGAK
jgi:tetratricopeptide (TPR) repeat protein